MFMKRMLGSLGAALIGGVSGLGLSLSELQVPPTVVFASAPDRSRSRGSKRRRTGTKYPFSSTRQQARFKKQLEAGHHANWA